MKRSEVAEFETVHAQLRGLYEEIQKLANKQPNDALNKFKLTVVNNLLRRTNLFLGKAIALQDFTEFSEELVPTNSDVLVVLSQYLTYLEKFRADHITRNDYSGFWF